MVGRRISNRTILIWRGAAVRAHRPDINERRVRGRRVRATIRRVAKIVFARATGWNTARRLKTINRGRGQRACGRELARDQDRITITPIRSRARLIPFLLIEGHGWFNRRISSGCTSFRFMEFPPVRLPLRLEFQAASRARKNVSSEWCKSAGRCAASRSRPAA